MAPIMNSKSGWKGLVLLSKIWRALSAAMVLTLLLGGGAQALGTMNYVLDTDGKTQIPTPVTHQVEAMYGYLGPEGGSLNKPTDLYIDGRDNVYIADTGNNRIVQLDKDGNFVRDYTDAGRLNAPEGVYVDADGDVYVGDTQNERIVHLDPSDVFIEEFVKPQSDMLDESMDFQVGRLGISPQGYIYLIRGQQFMTIDAENTFKGYVGANELDFSLTRILVRMFASREQQSKLLKEEPPAYNSFDIGNDGMVYATTVESKSSGQIRKINAVGTNIYPEKPYGETYFNEHTNTYNNPRFIDVAVGTGGLIYVLEGYTSRVYVYDQEGNLLTVFGGAGQVKGRFQSPEALEVNSAGDVFVLDGATGYIHRFAPTDFMKNVAGAVSAYESGDYTGAYDRWRQVLRIDVNYPVANQGIAQALYKDGQVDEAMKYYELADSKDGYGQAFAEYRYQGFRAYFGWIVLAGVIVAAGIILLIWWLKKSADRYVRRYFSGGDDA